LSKEECAGSMGQRSNYAAKMGVQIVFKMEDCASSMGHRSNDAAVKDAKITPLEKEYV
jgi:hypothetical protein